MSYFVFDVEADGPVPHLYSMVSFGVVLLRDPSISFYGRTRPITTNYDPKALAVSGHTRAEHETFSHPAATMLSFDVWAHVHNEPGTRMVLASDNPAFDFQWINYYLHRYLKQNVFGWSARSINDIFHGMKQDMRASFKHLRKTKHTHHPVDDARGNAEALQAMIQMGLKLKV